MDLTKINFAIPTVAHYMEKTLPVIINSLVANGIYLKNIHVFINDYAYDGDEIINDIHFHYKQGLSYFEWISPKLIIERNINSDWWFLCHDTIEFKNNFNRLLSEFMEYNTKESIKLTPTHSNSIGMLHQNIFVKHREFFIQKLNELDSISDLLERKRWCIKNENTYLHLEPFSFFQVDECRFTHNRQQYDVNRLEEYFYGIDIVKYKKNFTGHKNVTDVDL